MLTEFDAAVKQRLELQMWWKLGSTVAAYDDRVHKLHIHVLKPTMVAFCGQQYAGAENYHEAPEFFAEALRDEIERRARQIAKEVYEAEIARLTTLIDSQRAEVLKQFSEVEA